MILHWKISQILFKVLNLLLSGSIQNFLDGCESYYALAWVAVVDVGHEVSS